MPIDAFQAEIVKRFTTLSKEQRVALVNRVSDFAQEGSVEYYKNEDLRKS